MQNLFELILAETNRPFAKDLIGFFPLLWVRDFIAKIRDQSLLNHVAQGSALLDGSALGVPDDLFIENHFNLLFHESIHSKESPFSKVLHNNDRLVII